MIWCNKGYKIGIFKSNPSCSMKRKCCIEFSLFKLSNPYTRDKIFFTTLYLSTMGNSNYPLRLLIFANHERDGILSFF